MDSAPTMRITIDRASGGYRVHVWMLGNNELVFWSDIYASKEGAQRAAYNLKAHVATAPVEDLTSSEVSAKNWFQSGGAFGVDHERDS